MSDRTVPRCTGSDRIVHSPIEFSAEDGTLLRGVLSSPADAGRAHPCVVLQGTLASVERTLAPVSELLARAGLAVLRFDHRGLGISDGSPRNEIDPWQQCRDLAQALTFLETSTGVDPKRLGLWGVSSGAANALLLAAFDQRVRAVVAVAPPISGAALTKPGSAADVAWLANAVRQDRIDRWHGLPARTIPLFGRARSGVRPMFRSQGELAVLSKIGALTSAYHNEVTVRSFDLLGQLELSSYAARISGSALLVSGLRDTVCPANEIRGFFTAIEASKELVEVDRDHAGLLIDDMSQVLDRSATFLTSALD